MFQFTQKSLYIFWKPGENAVTQIIHENNFESYNEELDAKIRFDDVQILPLLKTEIENFDAEKETNVAIKAEIIEDDEVPTSTVDKLDIQELDLKFFCMIFSWFL